MVSTKLYVGIYVVLFASSTAQALFEYSGFLADWYWPAFALILLLSFFKASLVAGYYQHLRFEPRSLTYLIASALVIVLFLSAAASYSIT